MKENKQVMARNITNLMIKNNINATDLCKALDFKQNTFSDWVNGKTYPRIDKIEKMANYFGVPKAMLVEDIQDIEIFTAEERKMIVQFRNADQITKNAIIRLLEYKQ